MKPYKGKSLLKVKDQLGRTLEFDQKPQRIISVVPSITEMLYDFGVEPIAQTRFCIKPEQQFKESTKIGGTKKLKIDRIMGLKPDLIIANKEENLQGEIEELAKSCPVYISDISSIEDARQMILDVGKICGKLEQAMQLNQHIESSLNKIGSRFEASYLYFIWQKPFYLAGPDTFISKMLERTGFMNACPEDRYPELSVERIRQINPDFLMLSSEPFPFAPKHKKELQKLFPESKVILIDGEMTSWYGSRIPAGLDYLSGREFLNG